jgi:hypothetical protein
LQFVDLTAEDVQKLYANSNPSSLLHNPVQRLPSRLPFGIEPAQYGRQGTGAFKMLRVTVVDSTDTTVRLRVEGRLTGRCVEELRQSCELHALADGMRLTLDLADISFADADGIELLKDLRGHEVTILDLVPYLALQLRVAESRGGPIRNDGDVPEEG